MSKNDTKKGNDALENFLCYLFEKRSKKTTRKVPSKVTPIRVKTSPARGPTKSITEKWLNFYCCTRQNKYISYFTMTSLAKKIVLALPSLHLLKEDF